jgi:hypothetical protein
MSAYNIRSVDRFSKLRGEFCFCEKRLEVCVNTQVVLDELNKSLPYCVFGQCDEKFES